MAQLNYEVLRASGYKGFVQEKGVEKVNLDEEHEVKVPAQG